MPRREKPRKRKETPKLNFWLMPVMSPCGTHRIYRKMYYFKQK